VDYCTEDGWGFPGFREDDATMVARFLAGVRQGEKIPGKILPKSFDRRQVLEV
jgi:hypothetical protein